MTVSSDIIIGDCLEVLRGMKPNSVDSCVTDPPYGLEFMGKEWDAPWKSDRRQQFDGTLADSDVNPFRRSKVRNGNGQSYGADSRHMKAFQDYMTPIFSEILRVLKPGGHLLSFGGSRTYHRLACAIEDAGFEIRDQIQWIYGQGFPKSKNLDGDWQGWGTALKPAHEPIVLARKPLIGTVSDNVLTHGTGAINVDGCRVDQTGESRHRVGEGSQENRYTDQGATNFAAKPGIRGGDPMGRWPANVIHDGSDEVLAAFPDAKGQQGDLKDQDHQVPQGNAFGQYGPKRGHKKRTDESKSAARFFYCPKASRKDRGEGNNHPTVKPTELMQYLCRLITPPGGTIIDPFMGSGTTGIAALREGFGFIGIEKNADYAAIASKRMATCSSKTNIG